MGRLIRRPELEATSPPFFELGVGHSAKVLTCDEGGVFWVKVLEVKNDQMLGVVTTCVEAGERELRLNDVIEFESRHVFGLF